MEACHFCGKHGGSDSIRRCSRCKAVRYCSRDCQSRDWSRHRVTCREGGDTEGATASGISETRKVVDTSSTPEIFQVSPESSSADPECSTPPVKCQKCKRVETDMNKCGRCQEVTYCSRDCQRGDWRTHRVTCKSGGDGQSTNAAQKPRARLDAPPRHAEHPSASAASPASSAQGERDARRWAGLLGTLYHDPWQDARSRAMAAFPGNRVVDTFRDLDVTFENFVLSIETPFMPFGFTPFMPFMNVTERIPFLLAMSDAVLVAKTVATNITPGALTAHWWILEDKTGVQKHLYKVVMASEGPIQEHADGQFLCVNQPKVIIFEHEENCIDFLLIEDLNKMKVL